MHISILMLASLFTLAMQPEAPYREEEVTFRNGDVTLAGVLLLPPGPGPFPAAVIIHGAGNADRRQAWAAGIAQGLASRRVAVLLPDKRGCLKSEGDWKTADFDVLASDALAGVKLLSGRTEIDPKQIGLVGLSQGGRIAPVAASRSFEVAFVINVVGGTVTLAEAVTHEMREMARQANLTPEEIEAVMTVHRLAGEYIRTDRWEPYEAALRQGLESRWSKIAEGFPQTRHAWQWAWWRKVIDFDPLPYWRKVRQPTLMVFGGQDENMPVVASVQRLVQELGDKANISVMLFPSSGHGVKHAEALDLIVAWITRRSPAPSRTTNSL